MKIEYIKKGESYTAYNAGPHYTREQAEEDGVIICVSEHHPSVFVPKTKLQEILKHLSKG